MDPPSNISPEEEFIRGSFEVLPDEVLLELITSMNIESVENLCNSNKDFQQFCKDYAILETIFKRKIYNNMIDEIRLILIIKWWQKEYILDETTERFIQQNDTEINKIIANIYTSLKHKSINIKDIPYKKWVLRFKFGEILLKRKTFNAMVDELKGYLEEANVQDVEQFLEENDVNIHNAVNDMYDVYKKDDDLYDLLWSPELDWYRDFLYDHVDVPDLDDGEDYDDDNDDDSDDNSD